MRAIRSCHPNARPVGLDDQRGHDRRITNEKLGRLPRRQTRQSPLEPLDVYFTPPELPILHYSKVEIA